MRKRHQQPFTTIKTEGGLLPAELLQRIVEGNRDLDGLSPDSYHLAKNERLNEAINRSWNRCVGAWWVFSAAARGLPESDAGTTLTRERWLLLLFQELGYGRLLTSKAQQIDGKSYPISHIWHHTPIHLVSFRQDLDRRTPGMAGAARMSPHSLVQEFLNRSDQHLWGFVSNGYRLRILRDNVSLTRQAYVEFDIEGMMEGEVYSDFVLLYMLLHQSRVEAEKPEHCWLERWSQEAQQRGTRALDHLRDGVERAIAALGQGLIAHPANISLRDKLQSGELSTLGYYQQLLRLIYRMIFLFVAEDRDLLLLADTPTEDRRRYLDHYSISRIRRIAARLRGTRHGDLWHGLKVTFKCLGEGAPAMGLAPLGGFLFSHESLSELNDCELANEALLEAIRCLCFTRENKLLRPVDYRNLGTEELGSVYESLLELHPEVNVSAYTFDLKVAAGSERKTTGSYYTPSSLIKCLLDSALEPVIARALKEPDPEKALLDLKVVDPACGSGHFLIAAAHRIAKHLAMVRTGEAEPAPEERRRALRDVVHRCIYGVDVNPLAVELCKVALWIETMDPGKPLGFLDHQIKCGNSLIGATPELLEQGIPDDAFKPLVGDDRKVAAEIRRRNKQERRGQQYLFSPAPTASDWYEVVEDLRYVAELPEEALSQVEEKAALYETVLQDEPYCHQKQIADLWTATFFWPLTRETAASVPTQEVFRRFQEGSHPLGEEVRKQVEELASRHRFFHWHLEFPEVFTGSYSKTFSSSAGGMERGGKAGFDCVLGNPPWEQIELAEKEFFSQRDPEIANVPNAAARKQLISQLPKTNPSLWREFIAAKRQTSAQTHFIRASSKYPLSAVGRINSYQIFAGLARLLISEQGRAGIVIPSGIATDDSNKQFFADLTEKHALVSLYDFENREKLFPAVDSRMKFCLLTIGATNSAPKGADFAFFLTSTGQLREEDRHFSLSAKDIKLLNPNTRTCPIFRSKRDAELTKAIYRRVPVLIDETKGEAGNPWGITFKQGLFNMASDSHLFRTRQQLQAEGWRLQGNIFRKRERMANGEWRLEQYLPLYEAKMIHHFNHRFGDYNDLTPSSKSTQLPEVPADRLRDPLYAPLPRYWVPKPEVKSRLSNKWHHPWLLGWRDICRSTDERTVIASVVPRVAVGHTMPLMMPGVDSQKCLCLITNLVCFTLDYLARQKIGGTHLTFGFFNQLPVIAVNVYEEAAPWYSKSRLNEWLVLRILELTCTAMGLNGFAKDCGYSGPPFIWDEERRFLLRCELDAAYFHLYLPSTANREWRPARKEEGAVVEETPEQLAQLKHYFPTPRHAVEYIMETFPIVKRKDIQKYGDYRTKRVILECYDAMAEAIRTGHPYQTILDPPPADPSVAHQNEQLANVIHRGM